MKTMGQGVDPGAGEGPADFDNRRQWTRRTILWPASIRLGGQVRYCHLRNLSLGGVRARAGADIALAEGTEITVDIPSRGTFSATVAWQGGPDLGLSFRDAPTRVFEQLADIAEALGLGRGEPAGSTA
ncbi:PilZ domain-containing protein [Pseudokordiimonas caeni]|uniref:PilZ domain-containing protein n=1 Tax=Pseudokordiimonas caeni TaxID=2997908 RepID=UPI002810A9EE|nr:PilZ domain-containing protein [Pseudokordiimonas caeni]